MTGHDSTSGRGFATVLAMALLQVHVAHVANLIATRAISSRCLTARQPRALETVSTANKQYVGLHEGKQRWPLPGAQRARPEFLMNGLLVARAQNK